MVGELYILLISNLNIKNIFYYFSRWNSWFKWQQHQKFETLCSSRPTKNWKNKEEQVYPGRSWGSYSLRGREITSNRDQEKTRRRSKNYECVARNQQRDNWRICTYFGEYIFFTYLSISDGSFNRIWLYGLKKLHLIFLYFLSILANFCQFFKVKCTKFSAKLWIIGKSELAFLY